MKVIFHYDAGPLLKRKLEAFRASGLEIIACPESADDPFQSELKTAEAIWHVLKPITAETIRNAPNLKLIQKIGVGVNTIDLDAARSAGVAVCNMPGTNSRAVAEMTLLLMLSAVRLQLKIDRLCRSGAWVPDEQTRESFSEIAGKTIGLVGFGSVPQMLAPILRTMGATVIFSARASHNTDYEQCALSDLIARADIVSLHIPQTLETTRLFDERLIRSMKPGAIFVNTARGGLVDEDALRRALEDGHIRSAGLDVFSQEPVESGNALLGMYQVSLAPHLAWLTNETLERSIEVAVANTLAIAKGGDLVHRVA
jgi:phosphoglycerate dehydrogenase-like enzyme